jgi:hypothetical protein
MDSDFQNGGSLNIVEFERERVQLRRQEFSILFLQFLLVRKSKIKLVTLEISFECQKLYRNNK